ncbi:MAG: hypothetical protein H7A41_03015 [Chlamydiales bacterium]|nr:hypothetical protein [Chlamydiales bacterium]
MEGIDFRQTLKLGSSQLGLWDPNHDELTPVAKVALTVLSLIGAFYLHAKRVISHRALVVLSVTILALSYRFFITATRKSTSSDHKKVSRRGDLGMLDRKDPPSDRLKTKLDKEGLGKIFESESDQVSTDTQLKEGVENLSLLTVQQDGNSSTVFGEMDFSSDEEE